MSEDDHIRDLIAKHLGVDKVTNDMSFQDDLGMDSLDLVELTMAAEDEFSIEMDIDEAASLATVGDAVSRIKEARQK